MKKKINLIIKHLNAFLIIFLLLFLLFFIPNIDFSDKDKDFIIELTMAEIKVEYKI